MYIDEHFVEDDEWTVDRSLTPGSVYYGRADKESAIDESTLADDLQSEGSSSKRPLEWNRNGYRDRVAYSSQAHSEYGSVRPPGAPFFPEETPEPASIESYDWIERTSSLDELVRNLGESFQTRLFRMIDERELSDPEVYRRANIDRRLFSKIRRYEDYIPGKKTIMALAIALCLNLDDTRDLLASAGMTLANNNRTDVIVSFCIEHGIYDLLEVNGLLDRYDQPVLT